jgi:hypothetical protein
MNSDPKYIVFEEMYDYPCLISMPMIIFPASINHSTIAKKMECEPISAGFVNIKSGSCYGISTSLNIKSNPEIDNLLFKSQYKEDY